MRFSSLLFYNRSSQQRAGGFEHREEIPMEADRQERSPDEGALPSLCLKQVYPKYTKQFNYLRLVERIAALFIRFLGVKGNMRLGPTSFRTFIRYSFLFFFILLDSAIAAANLKCLNKTSIVNAMSKRIFLFKKIKKKGTDNK